MSSAIGLYSAACCTSAVKHQHQRVKPLLTKLHGRRCGAPATTMPRISVALIRKRAEHNEGCVSTLEELAIHQEDLDKIELLGQVCRHLKILYLQDNLINKLENLHRLKELEYLNVAVNNIQKIQNLQRCESLNKLDFTVNFIDKAGLLSVESLQANEFLKDLYLVGNPCTDFDGYREYVIATLPQLKRLDGKEVTPSERIQAKQNFPEISRRLEAELEAEGVDLEAAKRIEDAYNAPMDMDVVIDPTEVRPWSIETRIKDHRESRAEKEKNDTQKRSNMDKLMAGDGNNKQKPRREGFDPLPVGSERIYQKNEGDWAFTLGESDDGKAVLLDVDIGKYIDISLVDVDVQPLLVRMLCKGRLLQLELFEEVNPDKSNAQRSKTTGHLVITMPKIKEVIQAAVVPSSLPMHKVGKGGKGLAGVHAGEMRRIVGGVGDVQVADMRERPKASALMAGDSDSDDDVPPLCHN